MVTHRNTISVCFVLRACEPSLLRPSLRWTIRTRARRPSRVKSLADSRARFTPDDVSPSPSQSRSRVTEKDQRAISHWEGYSLNNRSILFMGIYQGPGKCRRSFYPQWTWIQDISEQLCNLRHYVTVVEIILRFDLQFALA